METPVAQQVVPVGGVRDEMLLRMWLHGRPNNTASAYGADAEIFLKFVGCDLAAVTLAMLQDWHAAMAARGLAEASRVRRLTVVRSLFKFAHGLGYLSTNPSVLLKVVKPKSTAPERIVVEKDVMRLIGAEHDPRRRAALRLLYVCGLRASEACDLSWKSMVPGKKAGGEARFRGKGGKERTVVIPADLWRELAALTPNPMPTSPVIPSLDGAGRLNRKALHLLVKRAAKRAGLSGDISAHWLRHSHASHSLDNGCAPHVLQQSMGHSSLETTTRYLHVRSGEGSASFIKAPK